MLSSTITVQFFILRRVSLRRAQAGLSCKPSVRDAEPAYKKRAVTVITAFEINNFVIVRKARARRIGAHCRFRSGIDHANDFIAGTNFLIICAAEFRSFFARNSFHRSPPFCSHLDFAPGGPRIIRTTGPR